MAGVFYPLNSVRLCIDRKTDGLCGRAYTPLLESPIEFADFGRLIIELDETFDINGYPQAFQDTRSFDTRPEASNRYKGKPEPKMQAEDIVSKAGEIATVDFVVNSRRSSSWQGILFNTNHEKLGAFIGEMELLSLIEKIL